MNIEFIYPQSKFDYFIVFLIAIFVTFIGILPVIAILTSVFMHEFGHYLFAKKFDRQDIKLEYGGYKGAVSYEEKEKTNPQNDMLITLAGPVFGLLCVIPLILLYYTTNIPQSQNFAAILAVLLVNIAALVPLHSGSDGKRVLSLYFGKNNKFF